MSFLQAIRNGVVVLDGAMGTMTQAMHFTDVDFGGPDYRMLGDLLCFSHPEGIEDIHLQYYRAGANAVETNTFGASPFRLSEYDFTKINLEQFGDVPPELDLRRASYEDIAYWMNVSACRIADRARERYKAESAYDGRPLFIIGSVGPSNRVLSKTNADLRVSTFDAVSENFRQQVLGLIDGGADVVLFETQQDILEVKAAVHGAQRAMQERRKRLPIMAQVTVDQFSKMQIFNTDIHAALVTVEAIGIDTFGINCSIGPDLMTNTVETLSRYSPLPISVIPNAGLPVSEAGKTVYKFTPEKMAEHLKRFVSELGVNIVGGCCGTGPAHIQAISAAVRGLKPAKRTPYGGHWLSGPQRAIELDSSKTLIAIGERLNVRGSKKVREAVERDGGIDHAALEEVVQEEMEALGVQIIDVCMDSNLVDTTAVLKEVIHEQTADFPGAMSIDSFAVDALRAGIQVYPGRPIVNSMSLEEVEPGVTKIEAVIRATGFHAPYYVGLCAGPKGPAATREDKAALAKQIVETAARFGVPAGRILVDMNVFPLGSEADPTMNFALESLEAIPLIKSIHPDLMTTCGIGNLTNGLASKPYMRKVLTSVWLDEGRKRGLDAAIINPNHYVFVENLDPHDYDLALRAILKRDMEAFEELERIAEAKKGGTVVRRTSYDDLPLEDAICEKIFDGFKEREKGKVAVDGHEYTYNDRIVLQAAQAIGAHEPLEFINKYLMGAMKRLGDGFGRGEVSLPHLLKSADVMKQVMGFLEEYMRVKSGVDLHSKIEYKGTIVLGTVYQDVHSIGKDLAKTLFENYGYRVVDLGVMTPLQEYLDKAREHNADAIGMSALLVQTSNHMITVSKMMKEQGLDGTYVLIGGAPVSDRHAAYVALAGDEDVSHMRNNVFYCPTAMDGVNVMNALMNGRNKGDLLQKNVEKLRARYDRAVRRAREDEELRASLPRRVISHARPSVHGKPWMAPETISVPLVQFRPYIDKRNLFSLNWKFGAKSKQDKQGTTQEELERLFLEWTQRAQDENWLLPQGVIACFPCYSEGEDVVVLDPAMTDKEIARFTFDVVIGAGREDTVCGAQYFSPRDSGRLDAVGFQITSGGAAVEKQIALFKESDNSEEALFLQGLSDRIAEDMAEYVHGRLRARIGLGDSNQGIRWSPGYPAITRIAHNVDIHRLLDAERHIGAKVTETGEFFPTGCTAAIVSFHPEARYS